MAGVYAPVFLGQHRRHVAHDLIRIALQVDVTRAAVNGRQAERPADFHPEDRPVKGEKLTHSRITSSDGDRDDRHMGFIGQVSHSGFGRY